MEDIVNFLRNKPTVELEEDIEYYLEKLDPRINKKFIRFFTIQCKLLQIKFKISLFHYMGWRTKNANIYKGNNTR